MGASLLALAKSIYYSVLNLQKRKYSQGNQIENYLFERLEKQNCSIKKQKRNVRT